VEGQAKLGRGGSLDCLFDKARGPASIRGVAAANLPVLVCCALSYACILRYNA